MKNQHASPPSVLTALADVYERLGPSERYQLVAEALSERTSFALLDLVDRRERQDDKPPKRAA